MNQRNKGHYKGVLSSFMATAMATSLIPIHHSQAFTGFADVAASHWALPAINRLDTAGLMKGYSSDFFGVGDEIKRGDFALIICNLMGYEVESTTYFQDLATNNNKYYNSALYKLNAALIMSGETDWSMGAENPITREQACFIMAKAFNIEPSTATSPFTDGAQILPYFQGYVQAMVELNIIGGFEDGTFGPKLSITREQCAGILSNLASTILSDTYSDPYISEGTVVLRSEDYDLSDAKITGDLILAEGVTDGEVNLDNVTVDGNLIIKGGGVDSIYLNDVTVGGKVLVSRQAGPVRVVFSGDTVVPTVEVKNSCTLDVTELSTSGSVTDVTIEAETYLLNDTEALLDEMNVILIGNYDTVTNDTAGVSITTEGIVTTFVLNQSATINDTEYEADTEINPDYPITEPKVVTVHDYGSALDDDELEPEATSTAEVVYFNEETGEVEVEITVEDFEDCVLMHDNVNAIKILNPTNNAGIATMDYVIGRTTYSKYTVFDVAFTMTEPCDEIQFQINFKAEDEEPTINLSSNFNDINSASATVAIAEDGISTASSGITTAFIEVSRVRNCEPHYSTEYVITQTYEEPEDLLQTVSYEGYDSDDDIYTYKVTFDSSELDSVDLTVNFLEVDAEDSMPPVRGSLYYGDDVLVSRLAMTQYDLNQYGMMTVDIIVDSSDLQSLEKDDEGDSYFKYYQLKSSMSRALTIVADSGETEKGYGLDYEAELSHNGSTSTYTITFMPSYDLDQVYFAVNVDDRDEGIPTMNATSNLSSRLTTSDLANYFVIHENTKTYSSRGVATVQVAVKDLEDITGYTLDVFNPIAVYDNFDGSTEEEEDEYYLKELSDYSVSKLDDETYEISFTPNTRTVTTESSDGTTTTSTVARKVLIQLNLERKEDYVGLFGSAKLSEGAALPYAKEVTEIDTDGYEYQLQLTVDNSDETWSNANGYTWTDGDKDSYSPKSEIKLILDISEENKEEITDKLKKLAVTVAPNSTNKTATITVRFATASRVSPEDLAFTINTPGSVIYVEPDVDFDVSAQVTTADTIATVRASEITSFNSETGDTIVKFSVDLEDTDDTIYEIPSDEYQFITASDASITDIDVEKIDDTLECLVTFTKKSTSASTVTFDLNFVKVVTPTVTFSNTIGATLTPGPVDTSSYSYENYEYAIDVTIPEGYELADNTAGKLVDNFSITGGSATYIISVTTVADTTNKYTITFNSNNAATVGITVDLLKSAPTAEDVLKALSLTAGLQANAMELPTAPSNNTVTLGAKSGALHGAVYTGTEDDGYVATVPVNVDSSKGLYFATDVDFTDKMLGGNYDLSLTDTTGDTLYFSYNQNGENCVEIKFALDAKLDATSANKAVYTIEKAANSTSATPLSDAKDAASDFTYFTLPIGTHLGTELLSFYNNETLVLIGDSNGITGTEATTGATGGKIALRKLEGTATTYLIYENVKYEVKKTTGWVGYEVDSGLVHDATNVISQAKITDQCNSVRDGGAVLEKINQ